MDNIKSLAASIVYKDITETSTYKVAISEAFSSVFDRVTGEHRQKLIRCEGSLTMYVLDVNIRSNKNLEQATTTIIAILDGNENRIKLYPTMADVETGVLNMLLNSDIGVVLGRSHGPVAIGHQGSITHQRSGEDVTFFDGSVLKCTTLPAKERNGMWGYSPKAQTSLFGTTPSPQNNQDELGLLRNEFKNLMERYNALESLVHSNFTLKCYGVEMHIATKSEIGECRDMVRNPDTGESIILAENGVFVEKDGRIMRCIGSTRDLYTNWYKKMLSTELGTLAIARHGGFEYEGVLFKEMTSSEMGGERGAMMMHNYRSMNGNPDVVISDYTHGVGYVIFVQHGRPAHTFKFDAGSLDYSKVVLGDTIAYKAKTPTCNTYAYGANIRKPMDSMTLIAARSAVAATIAQTVRERINYRRDNQMAIDRDFKLERILDFPKYDFLPEDIRSGELYRFTLVKLDAVVYVVFNGEDKPVTLNLSVAQTESLGSIVGDATGAKLRKHCERLAKHYNL